MWLRLRRYFLSGLAVFLPAALTIYLLNLTISVADGFLGKLVEPYFYSKFGFYITGISIAVCILFITLLGFLARNFLGRKITSLFEFILLKLPFFKQVYPAFKEIVSFFVSRKRARFKQVVILEYPRKGIYSVGFLTNESNSKIKEKIMDDMVNVFIPSCPGPFTGYVIMVSKGELIFPDISVEEAVKFLVSGGVVNPL